MPRRWLALVMVLSVVVVAALAWWDADRESQAALEDFEQQQATLSTTAAVALSGALDATPGEQAVDDAVLRALARIERPREVALFLAAPGAHALSATDHRALDAPRIVAAIDGSATTLWLSREEAASLGFPARSAVAGIARVDAPGRGRWAVVTVATARDVRDRQFRARWRALLGVAFAAGLVLLFGSLALRVQRKELELEHRLAIEDVRRVRDAELGRAGRVAMMGTLATGVAHEIATPLGIIGGRAEQILARAEDDERTQRAAASILDQTRRIDEVVRGFLDLSRSGRPSLVEVDPSALVDGAVRLVEHRFDDAGVRLVRRVPADFPRVRCDARLVEHALVNLLLNACQATARDGEVALDVRHDAEKIVFVVTDSGPGISDDAAAHALEPFFTTKPAGTGLGLAITNEIVKAHRGTLTIGARPNGDAHGTRASIELPIVS